jgi:hypothetical protein
MCATLRSLWLLGLLVAPAAGQELTVGIIDFYGLRTVTDAQARAAVTVSVGDVIDMAADRLPAPLEESQRRLAALPGVAAAHVNAVCCEDGRFILYFGVVEKGTARPRVRPAPPGDVRLPPDMMAAYDEFGRALMAAVQRGASGEDRSQGHALSEDPALRAVQERFIGFAARDTTLLRDVLREASDSRHRAVAAHVLGYVADKAAVIDDLVHGVSDPDEAVGNNAMRALLVIAAHASERPDLRLRVPTAPFVELLNSPDWSDLNKASAALAESSATRDAELMDALRQGSLRPLLEMARWKSLGHALPALLLLGRIGGMSDEQIDSALDRGDRDAVMAAALASR